VVFLLAVGLCLLWGNVLGGTWQELLDRADSLAAAGSLDSPDVAVDGAISMALTRYVEFDTTVEVQFYREGIRESYYFHSYAEAESLYTRVLSVREKALGRDHPQVAIAVHTIAWIYQTQARYAEAESVYTRSLAIREKVLEPEHTDLAWSLNNLANLYFDQGKYPGTRFSLPARALKYSTNFP
jgi:tetratricopeptide (TPR) repeat protein